MVLGTTLPLTYNGNTTGKPNLVSSPRLDWDTAPDDALLFVAPQAGIYRLAVVTDSSTNGGCGASVKDFQASSYYNESTCPAPGTVATIDGEYAAISGGTASNVTLTQGQHLLIFFSCATFSSPQFGPYTLTIIKQ